MSLDGRPGVTCRREDVPDAGARRVGPRRSLRACGSHLLRASHTICLLAASLLLVGCGEKSLTKVTGEDEAIEIVTILRQSGVVAEKQEVGEASAREWEILVEGSDYDLANRLLLYYELPHRAEKQAEANLFSYEAERQALQLKESRKQIERHLRTLSGVARVSVIISPQQDEAGVDPAPAKATVNVTHKEPQAPFTVDEVRQAVANSYPTLKPENVYIKLQFDPPPTAPRRETRLGRVDGTIFAIGLFIAVALTALLFILLRRVRRQRMRLAAMEADSIPTPEVEAEDDSEPGPLVTTTRPNADRVADVRRRSPGNQ